MKTNDVILIDDDFEVLEAYCTTFALEGLTVASRPSVEQGLVGLGPESESVIVSDVKMPRHDGFDLVNMVSKIDPEIPVILISGHSDIPMALKAMRAGAWDFIEKPADPIHVVETVRRARAHRAIILENRRLRLASRPDGWETRIIGNSAVMMAMRESLLRIANVRTDVLIIGETGTGKEVAARAIHDFGLYAQGRFVAVNCGAIPETMLESELFGYELGAFTGARERRIGKLEHANGGTLFLDEIESMPLSAQVRLLRVLQERTIERLGSNKVLPVDFRVTTATKHDLHRLASEGKFREDLAYRLDIARVEIPPLRERGDDVLLLFRHFVDLAARRQSRMAPPMDAMTLSDLTARLWPGNIRELRNVAERFILGLVEKSNAGGIDGSAAAPGDTLEIQIERCERSIILNALAANGGKIGVTADALGISRKTLYLKMRKFDIAPRVGDPSD